MNNPIHSTGPAASSIPDDVLHSDHRTPFTTEEIAKAVARHKREHPNEVFARKPQKTMPQH